MKHQLLSVFVLFLLFIPITAQDNEPESWEAQVFQQNGTITRINAQGIVSRVTIEEYVESYGGYDVAGDIAVSRDGNVMAFSLSRWAVQGDDRVAIADLLTETCCTILPPPIDNADFNSPISINPDGSILVTGYYERVSPPTNPNALRGEIITGIIVAYDISIDPPAVIASIEMDNISTTNQVAENIHFGQWDDDGFIQIAPVPRQGQIFTYEYSQWNPLDDALTDLSKTGDRSGIILPSEELIFSEFDELLPFSRIERSSFYQIHNAVRYRPADAEESYLIYHTPDLIIQQAILGMNGEAILIILGETSDVIILYRDGTSSMFSVDANDVWGWHGTPEGWLVRLNRLDNDTPDQLVHLTIENNGLETNVLLDEMMGGTSTFLTHPIEFSYTGDDLFIPFNE